MESMDHVSAIPHDSVADPSQINADFLHELQHHPTPERICALFVLNSEEFKCMKRKTHSIVARLGLLNTLWLHVSEPDRAQICESFLEDEELHGLISMTRWKGQFPRPTEWEDFRYLGIKGIVEDVLRTGSKLKQEDQHSYVDEGHELRAGRGRQSSSRHRAARFRGTYQADQPQESKRRRDSTSSSSSSPPLKPTRRRAQNASNKNPTSSAQTLPDPRQGTRQIPGEETNETNGLNATSRLKRFETHSERMAQSQLHGSFDVARATFVFRIHYDSSPDTEPVLLLPDELRFSAISRQSDEYDHKSFSFDKMLQGLRNSNRGFEQSLHGIYWFHDNRRIRIQNQDDLVRSLWVRLAQLSGEQTVIPYHVFLSPETMSTTSSTVTET